jgi:hypothetical protein
MASETIQKARTNVARNVALTKAKDKNILAGPDSPLKDTTVARLEAIESSYSDKTDELRTKKSEKVAATTTKTDKALALFFLVTHFLQVFMLGVIRKVFPAAALSYYALDVVDPTVPPLGTDAELTNVSKVIGTGDAARMAGTGSPVAMAMPTAAQVATARGEFITASNNKDVAENDWKETGEGLNALNTEADEVLNLVIGEVEATTVNKTAGAARDIGRTWGFIYVRKGSPKRLFGKVINDVTNEVIGDVDVRLDNGVNEDTTGADGLYSLNTTLMGEQVLLADHPIFKPYSGTVTFVENQDLNFDIRMTPL